MWQLSALSSLFARAGERVADKAALVYDHRIDSSIATLYRQCVFLFVTFVVGYLGWAGSLHLFWNWLLAFYAFVALISAYFYTLLLRRVEVTLIEAVSCLAPLMYLFIDLEILHVPLTPTEIIAIVILSVGGFAFALDGRSHKMKKELTLGTFALLAFFLFQTAVENYAFKYFNVHDGINGVSFFASSWLMVAVGALIIVAARGKAHLLFRRTSVRYIPMVAIGKSFDVANTLLWMYALTFAAVSQVGAIGALEPFVVFLVAILTQKEARIRIRERVDRGNLHWKVGAVALLVLGGFLLH